MINLTKDSVRKIVGSKFFAVEFQKKDGSMRQMTCRLGVTKHLKGGKSTTAHKDNLLTVFEIGKGYRSLNLDKVQSFKCGDVEFK